MRPILIPEYLQDFQCIGGACEDTCCAGWKVTIDKKTYQTYRKVKNPEISDKLNRYVKRDRKKNDEANYAKFILDDKDKCQMMLEDGLCSIHKYLGEESLCNTCAVYPRNLVKVGNTVEKSLTLSCPEAARIVLLREEGLGFIEMEEPKNTRGFMNNEIKLEKYPHFWDLRVFIIQLMQNRQHSIEIRLILLGLFFQKIGQLNSQELVDQLPQVMEDYLGRLDNLEYIESLQNIEGNLEFQINLARDLIRYRLSDGASGEKYQAILKQLLEGLALDEDQGEIDINVTLSKYKDTIVEYYEPFMIENDFMLENYIVNYVFKNLVPYDYNSLFESYMMLIIHFNLIKLHLVGMAANQQQLNQSMVVECVQQLAKTMEHNPVYLQGVRQGMEESGYISMAHMFVLIKS